jgi:hypothetical protein
MKRLTVAATLLLALPVAVAAGPAAQDATAACTAPAKSTAYDNPSDQDSDTVVGSTWYAQSFTLPERIILSKVSLYVKSSGSQTQGIVVEIRSDSGGHPGGTVLATHSAVLNNTTFAFDELDFSADRLSLAAGTTYYIVAHSAGSYDWGVDSSNATYGGGNFSASGNSGTNWNAVSTYSLLFQVFGQTCTADPQQQQQQQQQTNTTLPVAAASNLAFFDTTFAAEASGPSAYVVRKKAPLGTKVSFKLNEAASVRFTVTQRVKGRKGKRGKKTVCVKPTRKNRKKKSCTRVVTLKGSFSRSGVAGKNSFHFTGRLNGRKLKPGRYRLVATPSAGGKKGKSISTGFRIVR